MKKMCSKLLPSLAHGILCAVTALLFAAPLPAHAGAIQMLPPLNYLGKPCNTANGTGGILQWDGAHAITCVPGLSGDVTNGNVFQSGNTTLNNGMNINGSWATFGSNSPVTIAGLADSCRTGSAALGGNVAVTASGTVVCCPLGQVMLNNGCGIIDGPNNQ